MQNRALYRLASFIRMDSGIDSYGVGSIGLSIPADGCVAGTARAGGSGGAISQQYRLAAQTHLALFIFAQVLHIDSLYIV